MRKNEEEQGAKVIRSISSVLIGAVLAVLICLIFLFLCSFMISQGILNDRNMQQYTLAGCVLGGLIGGIYTVTRCRSRTLLVGLATGFTMFLLNLMISFLFYSDMSFENHGIGFFLADLFGGALAGLLGGKPKKKRRK